MYRKHYDLLFAIAPRKLSVKCGSRLHDWYSFLWKTVFFLFSLLSLPVPTLQSASKELDVILGRWSRNTWHCSWHVLVSSLHPLHTCSQPEIPPAGSSPWAQPSGHPTRDQRVVRKQSDYSSPCEVPWAGCVCPDLFCLLPWSGQRSTSCWLNFGKPWGEKKGWIFEAKPSYSWPKSKHFQTFGT